MEYIASTIHKLQNKGDGKRRLFLIQTYVIGKEHILIEVRLPSYEFTALVCNPPDVTFPSFHASCSGPSDFRLQV